MKKEFRKVIGHSGTKRSGKQERERKVLLGLVDLYLQTGKPIGSNTLRENGFNDLSSATIRNYFAALEEAGLLDQQHVSGGRSPTHSAYRLYVEDVLANRNPATSESQAPDAFNEPETREIAGFLQQAADQLSAATQTAVFISAPRFDHDFIQQCKLVFLDCDRCLCVLITDFGLVHTEVLRADHALSPENVLAIEEYFHWRFTGLDKPEELDEEQAQRFYNEVMVRYLVGYSNFAEEDLYRTGFSELLAYPEFNEAANLAGGLSLFENPQGMRLLLRECCASESIKCWIGDDLNTYTLAYPNCAVVAAPYKIGSTTAGGIGLLGPSRLPYRQLVDTIEETAKTIGERLTRAVQKFRIQYRKPERGSLFIEETEKQLVPQSEPILLENYRGKEK